MSVYLAADLLLCAFCAGGLIVHSWQSLRARRRFRAQLRQLTEPERHDQPW